MSSAGDFGSVTLSGNANLQTRGERNQGAITQTSNLNIFSINCVLNLYLISNGKMNTENSNIQVSLCPNLSVDGNGNTAVLSDNSNSKFNGDNNQWDAKDNSNLDVWGTGNILKINRNSNSKFGGDRCNVIAEDNSNLSVLGDDIKATIRGTSNHVVTK
ncbi:hypothetical protein Ocin01_04164 [Orchesella cincta]|uniref:Uncharacterized protein n=1 Tax=Orchesella cincta TaxID=48709 RepID=A0A1D2NB69_ORCCI|nr:hypothetical protein Ocin01_04164 [Orchesella cincta]